MDLISLTSDKIIMISWLSTFIDFFFLDIPQEGLNFWEFHSLCKNNYLTIRTQSFLSDQYQ